MTDGKLSTKFEKGGQMTAQLYVDPASGERMLQAEGKDSLGFTYSANLKRTGDSISANDGPGGAALSRLQASAPPILHRRRCRIQRVNPRIILEQLIDSGRVI